MPVWWLVGVLAVVAALVAMYAAMRGAHECSCDDPDCGGGSHPR